MQLINFFCLLVLQYMSFLLLVKYLFFFAFNSINILLFQIFAHVIFYFRYFNYFYPLYLYLNFLFRLCTFNDLLATGFIYIIITLFRSFCAISIIILIFTVLFVVKWIASWRNLCLLILNVIYHLHRLYYSLCKFSLRYAHWFRLLIWCIIIQALFSRAIT